jgi:molybdate transport system substrate-binding protein
MNTSSLAAGAMLGAALLLWPAADAMAAELQVLAGGGIAGPMRELGPAFERKTGNKVVFRFGTTPELIKLATGGEPFDLAVVPREVFRDAAAQASVIPGPTTDVARVGLGVAVRAGAARPDIGTPDAFKRALLEARSIATIPASAAGAQVMRAFERLGIAEAIKDKIKVQAAPPDIVRAVASGDAELGIFLINTLTAPGIDVVGPFPADLQQEVVFTSALAANAKETEAAKAFLDYLKTPEAAALFRAKGVTPG